MEFLRYPALLSAAEVAELEAAVLAAIDSMGRRKIAGDGAAMTEGDGYYDRIFTQRLNLWRISEVVRSYLHAGQLGRLLCDLEGIDGIRVWHDQALIKEPFANATPLHLDNPYWSFHSPHAISIWIALTDATLQNGCMCFIPGSQRGARYDQVRFGADFGGLLTLYPEFRHIEPVLLPLQAGDCSFHNGLTAHGAGVNTTTARRIAMTCAYMPDGSTFNGQQNVLPERYFRGLAVGDVLADDSRNPLVFRRTSQGNP